MDWEHTSHTSTSPHSIYIHSIHFPLFVKSEVSSRGFVYSFFLTERTQAWTCLEPTNWNFAVVYSLIGTSKGRSGPWEP